MPRSSISCIGGVYVSPTAPWHNTAALPQENAAFEAFYRAQGVVPEVRPPPPPPPLPPSAFS